MKKIGFLSFGIILVIAILALPKEGLRANMKRIALDATQRIENVLIKVSNELRSFINTIEDVKNG